MFRITDSKGFQMTFKNGVTVSVQFGPYSYCDNYCNKALAALNHLPNILESKNAEIAAWGENGRWITRQLIPDLEDDVKGYCSAEEVLEFINKASRYEQEEQTL